MVVTKLIGGLGNQMFQYAAGRSLALRQNSDFFIDRKSFDSYKLHEYGLHNFDLVANDYKSKYFNLISKRNLEAYVEKTFTFDRGVLELKDPVFLDGYWQSEKYFNDYSVQIRNDFIIKTKPNSYNQAIAENVKKSTSVSIHVRRGDYVSNPDANRFHGTCSLDYYKKSIEYICDVVKKPVEFFIFSDDTEWAKENLNIQGLKHHFVSNSASTNYEDLRLMALCKHNIVANSTFSWWGAWLNSFEGKEVVAPSRWFADDTLSDRDLIPTSWVRI